MDFFVFVFRQHHDAVQQKNKRNGKRYGLTIAMKMMSTLQPYTDFTVYTRSEVIRWLLFFFFIRS